MRQYLTGEAGELAVMKADLTGSTKPRRLDPSDFVGTWVNSNRDSLGLERVICKMEGETLAVQAFGKNEPAATSFGKCTDLALHAVSPTSDTASGVSCQFTFPFMTSRMQANIKGGVMVAVTYNEFTDLSERRPYFMREFLSLEKDE